MSARTAIVALAAATALAAAVTGCATEATPTTPAPTTEAMVMDMGDPDATPASQVPDAQLSSGEFARLATAPTDVSPHGEAVLARHADGTTVTLHLQGLPPNTGFMAHVHEGACHEAGGAHYRHDPTGSDVPPNEIHLAFATDANGHGMMTAENPHVADERAVSVVVHLTGPDTPKLACADLDPVSS